MEATYEAYSSKFGTTLWNHTPRMMYYSLSKVVMSHGSGMRLDLHSPTIPQFNPANQPSLQASMQDIPQREMQNEIFRGKNR